jgi:tRNA A-37 threonylcarbamoyl transferase component Bud32
MSDRHTRKQNEDDIRRLERAPDAPSLFSTGASVPGISSWVFDRRLGVGGFGEVWLVRHEWKDEWRAVKFCTHPTARVRLVSHEKNLIVRVMRHGGNHPNIVPLLDYNLAGETPWLMYEYVPGGTLRDAVEQWRGRQAGERLERAVAILHALAAAVGHFHLVQPPIVHRDLKPANVLMADGVPRITDFGIGGVALDILIESETRDLSAERGRLPTFLHRAGSLGYASPQQLDGAPPDPRDDVHALGVIGLELVTARRLGGGVAPDFADELREHGADRRLSDILGCCLAARPDRRMRNAAALAEALLPLLPAPPPRTVAVTGPVHPPPVRPVPPRRDEIVVLARSPGGLERLWCQALDDLRADDRTAWQARWSVVLDVGGTEAAAALLLRAIESDANREQQPGLPPAARGELWTAVADVVGRDLASRPAIDYFRSVAPVWAGYTAFIVLWSDTIDTFTAKVLGAVPSGERPALRDWVHSYLRSADSTVAFAYCQAAQPYLSNKAGDRFDLLDPLLKPYSKVGADVVDRLLAGVGARPGAFSDAHELLRFCSHVGLTQDRWGEFLLENDRLAKLLVGLGGQGVGREMWGAYLDLLTPALISPDLAEGGWNPVVVHEWERKVHAQLNAAAQRLIADGYRLALALSDGGVSRLFAANNLLTWVSAPGAAAWAGPEEVRYACKRFGLDRLNLVRVAYKKGGYDRLDLPAEVHRLEPIIQLFSACYPVDSQYHTARTAVTYWLKLSQDCPKSSRGVFQAQFVLKHVPRLHYSNLLAEQRQVPFEPIAEVYIKQGSMASLSGGRRPEDSPAGPPPSRPEDRKPKGCPKCGRSHVGDPGQRYCLLCDVTY